MQNVNAGNPCKLVLKLLYTKEMIAITVGVFFPEKCSCSSLIK